MRTILKRTITTALASAMLVGTMPISVTAQPTNYANLETYVNDDGVLRAFIPYDLINLSSIENPLFLKVNDRTVARLEYEIFITYYDGEIFVYNIKQHPLEGLNGTSFAYSPLLQPFNQNQVSLNTGLGVSSSSSINNTLEANQTALETNRNELEIVQANLDNFNSQVAAIEREIATLNPDYNFFDSIRLVELRSEANQLRSEAKRLLLEYIDGDGLEEFRYYVVKFTNEHRVANGLHPLITSERLNEGAQARIDNLIASGWFEATNPGIAHDFRGTGGLNTRDFARMYGASSFNWGTNIREENVEETARTRVNSWINSPGHNRNMLNPNHRYIGVGTRRNMAYQFFSSLSDEEANLN